MAFHKSSALPVTIEISNRQSQVPIDPEVVRNFAARVLQGEGVENASISIAFVDDAAIHTINRRHLQHDWPTDVITFRLSDSDEEILEAELVVSGEMAATTAHGSGANARDELMLYIVHGLLHLCGYDDVSENDALQMRQRESEVLSREGWANTFARIGPDAETPLWTV